jgi:hypothetical protein
MMYALVMLYYFANAPHAVEVDTYMTRTACEADRAHSVAHQPEPGTPPIFVCLAR